ncbi:hypothetical protein K440DRAFT_643344 [Wilcoxina mikolae CBS 423.85]|nr:hypothetical protein K440DRAFT_643344 [Wilcoxina mikolae CBS 423.85]
MAQEGSTITTRSSGSTSDATFNSISGGAPKSKQFRCNTLQIAIMDSYNAEWWINKHRDDIDPEERILSYIQCTFGDQAYITLGFSPASNMKCGSGSVEEIQDTDEFRIRWDVSIASSKNRLTAYSLSYDLSILTLVLQRQNNWTKSLKSYRRKIVDFLDKEWNWAGVAVIQVVLQKPHFAREFQRFANRYAPPGTEVFEAVIGQFLTSYHFKIRLGIKKEQHFEGTKNYVNGLVQQLVEQRICPGCGIPCTGDAKLYAHFDSSEMCDVVCSCGQTAGNGTLVTSLHSMEGHALSCRGCNWSGDWMGLQVHYRISTGCIYELNRQFNAKYVYGGGVVHIGQSAVMAERPVYSSKHPLNKEWRPHPTPRPTSLVAVPEYVRKRPSTESTDPEAKRLRFESLAVQSTSPKPTVLQKSKGLYGGVTCPEVPAFAAFRAGDRPEYDRATDNVSGTSLEREMPEEVQKLSD